MRSVHIPILVDAIGSGLLEPFQKFHQQPGWLLDCTLGGGGHTRYFLKAFSEDPLLAGHRVIAIDQDLEAVERAKQQLGVSIQSGKLVVFHAHWNQVTALLQDRPILGILADLGFSSDQLEDPARGLSFQWDGPLDMRLDQTRGVSCQKFLSQVSERELEKILREYGEERFSRRIASQIILARRQQCLPQTTQELAQLVCRTVPAAARHQRIHPATRTFQALRIVINDELSALDTFLDQVVLGVRPGGRVAILSFHSLEDRKVKVAFQDRTRFQPITQKPIRASDLEVAHNPRARSAKLRIAERVDESTGGH